MSTLGERIKQIRLNSGMNQVEFAGKLSVTTKTAISLYERNEREPKVSDLITIAEIGSVTLAWLLTGQGEMLVGQQGTESQTRTESAEQKGFCRDCAKLEGKLELVTEERDLLKEENRKMVSKIGRLEGQIEVLEIENMGLVAKQNRFNAG